MSEQTWKTAITDIAGGQIRVRGYDIADLMEHLSFADVVYLILRGELPDNQQRRMMEAMLVSSIDHGPTPPSNLAARTIFSGGNSLNAAVAAGVMTIGDSHGGAIEKCAFILQEWTAKDGTPEELAKELVVEYKEKKKRMPGYGHRIHKRDPRTIKLLEIAERIGYKGRIIELAVAIQDELEKTSGRNLPLNVDGAIAAVISEMGFDWRLGKGFFIISRVPGLVAHVFEEWTREKPMRKMGPLPFEYDGPAPREIS
ncbi:citryl-CoA lyase [candidate division LCP-89 bacterium B3_LCP]|uniref:citrate synthase (unknown stereospecificity) n=1 Tax=candidate division LCP-89 bacterium B3_LCP TaxID=2012998 RepID=A0A532V106_UNCL8|nr:MAG: citryl-CoA lyase [candidate division LCP-89 bacterium B3_LCP]